MLGALVAYTRQLDVQLVSDEEVVRHLDRFMCLMEPLREGPGDAGPEGGSHEQGRQDTDPDPGR
jgi:pyruvate,water dikinase